MAADSRIAGRRRRRGAGGKARDRWRENLPRGSARAQTRALPRCQVAAQRNLEHLFFPLTLRTLPSP